MIGSPLPTGRQPLKIAQKRTAIFALSEQRTRRIDALEIGTGFCLERVREKLVRGLECVPIRHIMGWNGCPYTGARRNCIVDLQAAVIL